MTVAICDVGCRGRLDLKFALREGRTIIPYSYCEVPFKITRLFPSRGGSGGFDLAHLILMHCTAGIFGGDRLECTIHVESGARVRITQQSATRVHPSGGRLAHQTTRIHVEPGAELVFDCEPVIPFAGSRFCQETLIDAAPGSRLVLWEALMAGRIGRNELWQFDELSTETRLESDSRTIFLERFGLFPSRRPVNSEWVAGGAGYMGTGLYFGPDASRVAELLHDALPESGCDSPIPELAVARVLSVSGPEFHHSRAAFMKAVS